MMDNINSQFRKQSAASTATSDGITKPGNPLEEHVALPIRTNLDFVSNDTHTSNVHLEKQGNS
jgi:hypothetical protein